MIAQGATTLWEIFEGTAYMPGGSGTNNDTSWNHIMFGSVGQWYYEHVAGVRLPPKVRARAHACSSVLVGLAGRTPRRTDRRRPPAAVRARVRFTL